MKSPQAAFSFFISVIIFLGSTIISFLLTIFLGGLFGIYGLIVLTMLYMLCNLFKKDNKPYNKPLVSGMIIGTGIALMVVVWLMLANFLANLSKFY